MFDALGKRIVRQNQELYVMADKQAAWSGRTYLTWDVMMSRSGLIL